MDPMDPYRSSMQVKIRQLEEEVKNLSDGFDKHQVDVQAKIEFLHSLGHESFSTRVVDLLKSVWPGVTAIAIVAVLAFSLPLVITAASDTPEERRAYYEQQTQVIATHETSCQSLGMHYIGHTNNLNPTLTCGNEEEVATIMLRHHDIGDQVEITRLSN